MRTYNLELELIANDILDQNCDGIGAEKPNYSNRDFMNCLIIFQTALMDKMWDNQEFDGMTFDDRLKMAETCGNELSKLIHTFTGLDTKNLDDFL